jgi:D-alanyl-D-alanine carboxypeptidase/D-alanyl-D-alanine-endopeptidase (penicillin-binding protein 4)
MVVVDPSTNTTLASRGDRPLVPASSMKVLTAAVALDLVGADTRFTTSVVQDGERSIVLVGGGDPLLTDLPSKSALQPASLTELAHTVAAALRQTGAKKVQLGYDDTLFTGLDFSPGWKKRYRSFVPPVSALTVDSGRYDNWQAHRDPAAVAAEKFADRLRAEGIKVTAVAARPAPDTAIPVAQVTSAPLAAIVKRTLRISDNVAAEILARHAAIAGGQPGSFEGAAAAISGWLGSRNLWDDAQRLTDGSGLSDSTLVRPSILAGVVSIALADERLAALVAGLPVAGVSGTLKDRFDDPAEKAGRRVVHAKTGTLTGISSLTGYLTTRDDARLAFSAVVNQAVGQTTAYNWLDRSASVVARCGCR